MNNRLVLSGVGQQFSEACEGHTIMIIASSYGYKLIFYIVNAGYPNQPTHVCVCVRVHAICVASKTPRKANIGRSDRDVSCVSVARHYENEQK